MVPICKANTVDACLYLWMSFFGKFLVTLICFACNISAEGPFSHNINMFMGIECDVFKNGSDLSECCSIVRE
jgi:hypothetical protein